MKPNKFLIIIIALIASITLNAQYIQFSQYYASPMVLAPSFTGTINNSRVTFNYRDQWAKIQGVYRTFSVGYDMHVPKVSSGFGVILLRDVAGPGNLGRSEFGVNYSWYTLLNKNIQLYFRPGIEFKLSQRSVDFQKLIFGDQITSTGTYNPMTIEPIPENAKKTYVDAATSILFYMPEAWAGVSVDHLFRPVDAFYNLNYRVPLKYSAFVGYKFKLGTSGRYGHYSSSRIEDWFFVSAYMRRQSAATQLDFGGYWEHLPITIGIWVRGVPYLNITHSPNIDAVIFMVGYKIYNFSVGYSYDFTVSPLLAISGGSHEISISYNFDDNLRSKKRDGPIPCPNL